MFTVLLGKRNRLFHQIRSQDSTLISVLLNAVLTVSHDIHGKIVEHILIHC